MGCRLQTEGSKMTEKVVRVEPYARYVEEIKELKRLNVDLENLNRDLNNRMNELHGEYMLLRYQMKGMASQAEVLSLRKKILELENELRLKCVVPRQG
jgi:polyhydroxyalkanoate synthesis regulator phasin